MVRRRIPKLCRHRASGQAVVRLGGRDHYLGRWKSPEAEAAYHRLIAEHLASGPAVVAAEEPRLETVAELLAAFLGYAEATYRKGAGVTSEVGAVRAAAQYAARLYADLPLEEFGPRALRAVRQTMIAEGLARTTINAQVGRLRRIVRWAVSHELCALTVYQRLQTVEGLRAGRGGREPPPRQDVPREHVEAIAPHLSHQVWAMVVLQWLTGMRPGEVVALRTCDLYQDGSIWLYRPPGHKTEHHGRPRVIALGPEARRLLAAWIRPDEPQVYLFQPREAEAARHEALRREREARGGVGNHKRPAVRPRRSPDERYSVGSYCRAVVRACAAAGVPRWTPHQLRHAFATRAAAGGYIEDARAALGHADLATTLRYAHADEIRAAALARRMG